MNLEKYVSINYMLYQFLFLLLILEYSNSYIFDPFHFFSKSQMIRIEDSNVIINSDKAQIEPEELHKIIKDSIQEINNNDNSHNIFNFLKSLNINNMNEYLLNNIENENIVNKIKENNMFLFRKETDILPELHRSGDKLLMFNKHIIDKLLDINW